MTANAEQLGSVTPDENVAVSAMAVRPLYLHIDSGNHQGARVELDDGRVLSIGSVLEADIYLSDAEVAPLHACVERIGDSVRWQSRDAELSLFGIRLPKGKSQLLCGDCEVVLGGIKLVIAGAERDADQALRAQRTLLRQRAPLRYVLFEWKRLGGSMRLALICAALIMALLAVLLNRANPAPTVESVQELEDHMRKIFPHVKVVLDEQQAAIIYTGYVDRAQDLERLRLQAWNISTDFPLIRVFAMSEVAAASRTYLERIYRSVQLRVTGPGTIAADVPADIPAQSLDAWDFDAIASTAQRTIPGLQQLRIAPTSSELKQVQSVPLAQLGLNLVTGPYGAYLRGKNGEQLFAGSVLREGTLLQIDPCKVLLHPAGTDHVYRLVNKELNNATCR